MQWRQTEKKKEYAWSGRRSLISDGREGMQIVKGIRNQKKVKQKTGSDSSRGSFIWIFSAISIISVSSIRWSYIITKIRVHEECSHRSPLLSFFPFPMNEISSYAPAKQKLPGAAYTQNLPFSHQSGSFLDFPNTHRESACGRWNSGRENRSRRMYWTVSKSIQKYHQHTTK